MEPQSVFDMVAAKFPWVKPIPVYYLAWTVLFKLFNERLQGWFARVLAAQVTDPSNRAQMHALLQTRWYRTLAFLCNFLSVKLPTDRMFHEQCAAQGIQLPDDQATSNMKTLITTALLALSLTAGTAMAQTTNAIPTSAGSFVSTVQSYFSSFNTNLNTTFGQERGSLWTGVISFTGSSSASLANEIGGSYNLWTGAGSNLITKALSLEATSRNGGVAGTLTSEQGGLGFSIVVVDLKLTAYADGGYDIPDRQPYAEFGLRAQKALTTHTYAGVGIGQQAPRSAQVFGVFAGFTF